MMNYITKTHLMSSLLTNKINFKLAPMGSGKTTATKEIVKDYLRRGKTVLVLTPYIISKFEYTKDEELINYIENEKLFVGYLTVVLDKFFKNKTEYIYDLKKQPETYNQFIKEVIAFRKYFEETFNMCDLIILDEGDFVTTQSSVKRNQIVIQECENRYTYHECVVAMMIFLARSSAIVIAISANKFPKIDANTIKISAVLAGLNTTFDDIVDYEVIDLKSNINIKSFKIINLAHKINFMDAKEAIFRGVDEDYKTIVYSSKKHLNTILNIAKQKDAAIYVRNENLQTKYDSSVKNITYKTVAGYEHLFIIDNENNLSNDTFQKYNIALCNLSSSRALSITEPNYNARVIIFGDKIDSGVTQIIARFRKAPIEVFLITYNRIPEKVIGELKTIDRFLLENVKIDSYTYDKISEIKKVLNVSYKGKAKGKAVGKAKGKAVGRNLSDKTKKRRDLLHKFLLSIDLSKITQIEAYRLYIKEVAEENQFGKTSFKTKYNEYKKKIKYRYIDKE